MLRVYFISCVPKHQTSKSLTSVGRNHVRKKTRLLFFGVRGQNRITYLLLSKAEETPHIYFSRLTKPSSSGCKVKTQILLCCMYQSEHECDYLRHCLFKQTCKSVYKTVCWFDRMWYGVIVLVMWYGVIVLVMRNRVFVRLVKLLRFDHFCLLT